MISSLARLLLFSPNSRYLETFTPNSRLSSSSFRHRTSRRTRLICFQRRSNSSSRFKRLSSNNRIRLISSTPKPPRLHPTHRPAPRSTYSADVHTVDKSCINLNQFQMNSKHSDSLKSFSQPHCCGEQPATGFLSHTLSPIKSLPRTTEHPTPQH